MYYYFSLSSLEEKKCKKSFPFYFFALARWLTNCKEAEAFLIKYPYPHFTPHDMLKRLKCNFFLQIEPITFFLYNNKKEKQIPYKRFLIRQCLLQVNMKPGKRKLKDFNKSVKTLKYRQRIHREPF